MKLCVQGLWHLGSVTAACLASLGHEVTGLDFDTEIVNKLKQGRPPLFEPGLEDLINNGILSGKLVFSSATEESVRNVDVLWVCYDTPIDDNDNADVGYVIAQVEKTLSYLPVGATVLLSSQMPVCTIKHLEKVSKINFAEKQLGFAYSPENLRLGKALEVFLKPDRIIAGVRSNRDRERLDRLFRTITDRIEWMSVESAEMTKHAINAFLAVSVTFANEIASICELVGADAREVERGLKSEARIGPKAYLSPGSAFAGGTLSRDIVFLNKVSSEKHMETPLLSSVNASNDKHKDWVKRKLTTLFPNLSTITVAIWGLTYKPGTDTLRRSMAVELCNWLIEHGVKVKVHDPVVNKLPETWVDNVERCSDPIETIVTANVLVLCTEWPQYREIASSQIVVSSQNLIVIDANRFLSTLATKPGVTYIAVGTPDNLEV